MSEAMDGSYVVGGYFSSGPILDLGDGVTLKVKGSSSGLVVKYSSDGKTLWAKAVGTMSATSIEEISGTSDNGCIVGCEFLGSSLTLENGSIFTNKSTYLIRTDVVLIKYNSNGEIEWAKSIGGQAEQRIKGIFETANGGYVVGLCTDGSNSLYFDNTVVRCKKR